MVIYHGRTFNKNTLNKDKWGIWRQGDDDDGN